VSAFTEAVERNEWPDCYLHVRECRSDEQWIRPIGKNAKLDLAANIRKWVKEEFAGELFLDGKIMPKLEGDYYATIITDGRPPDSVVVWTSGGFYLTSESCALLRSKS
tara:strand:+ start:9179 stop:9502 length:324 start_codon:yes stop_codon:yes gene_type:complete